MPVTRFTLENGIGVGAVRAVNMEFLALKLLGKRTLQLNGDCAGRIGVYFTEVDAGVLGINPELGDQLIDPA